MAITLAQLRQRCRERADMESTEFVTDSELNFLINQSIAELHDILVQSYGEDYYVESTTFNTVNKQEGYSLSSIVTNVDTDERLSSVFYKLRGIDIQLNGNDYFTIQPFNFNERNRFQHFGAWDFLGIANVRYKILGNEIRFTPVPDGDIKVRLWYIPRPKVLTDDTDTYDSINSYDEYVITNCAIIMKDKEESDTSVLLAMKQQLQRRIEEAAKNRDAANPESIRDVYNENTDFFFGRTKG